MRLSNERYGEIKDEAINMLVQYKICSIPIIGFNVAEKLGIDVFPYSFLPNDKKEQTCVVSKDGLYCVDFSGKDNIFYNDEMSKERINMTILHEIAHCVLGHHDGMSDEEKESEAGFFAKYVIAPPPLIHDMGLTSPEDIYKYFLISWEASNNVFNYYMKWLNRYVMGARYENEDLMVKLYRQNKKEVRT